MAIPDFQALMLPLLEELEDGKLIKLSEMVDVLSDKYKLTEEERNEWLPSKVQKTMYNRVSWAKQYLKNSELIETPEKGSFKITQKGIHVLKEHPQKIDLRFLKNLDTENSLNPHLEIEDNHIEEIKTPEELIENAQLLYLDSLKKELLAKLKAVDPVRFEQIVIQLMEKMNYGVGAMTKRSHDGGIDGIIDEDELGLEKIYLQAKRYSENKVNEKEMVYFIGALTRAKVHKGVFITTSEYSDKAVNAAKEAANLRIELVDGEKLTKLMIKHNLGVQIKTKIEIKKIDEDFFIED
jgi:restriction system protein